MRILVIEDETQLARHIARALMRHGHVAATVQDGGEGLRTALADPPDLIVLDLNLPTLDGLGVLAGLERGRAFRLHGIFPSRRLTAGFRGFGRGCWRFYGRAWWSA